MARLEEERTELIIENASDEGSMRDLSSRNPMVLSCGGIFLPRPRSMNFNSSLYQVLNLANEKEPTKVVNSNVVKNLLQEILHKESLN